METSKVSTKEKRSPDGISYPNQKKIVKKHNLLVF